MKHTKKNLSDSQIEFKIAVDAKDVAKHHAAAVKKLSRDVKVSGFRAGHVPAEVAEKHIDPAHLADEAINTAINEALVELIELEQLQLLDRPDINVTKFVPGQDLEFTAKIEIVPPIKLADPAKLKTKKEISKVEAGEVDAVIQRLLSNGAESKTVERAAKIDDEVVIDFDGRDEKGQPVEGAKGEGYPLKLGSKTFIPGFEEGLVGKKAGDSFDLPLTFPEDYGSKKLAGAKVTFKVTVKEVHEFKLPELTDEYAKTLAPDIKDVAGLKADIKNELEARSEFEANQKFQDSLLEELTDKSTVPTPEVLVQDQLTALEQNFAQNLMYRGQTLDQYLDQEGLTREDWITKELRPAAEKRVRNSLVMAQLTRDWNITVTDNEVKAQQEKVVAQYSDPSLKARFQTPEANQQIAQQLMAEKTLAHLAELNSK